MRLEKIESFLDSLLREALFQEQLSTNRRKQLERQKEIQKEIHSTFSNPDNWTCSGVISVIHTAEDGTQTTLGMFQEYRHKRVPNTRKLSRVEQMDSATFTSPIAEEYVSGQLWLNGKQIFSHEPDYHSSPEEQFAIRQYLDRIKPIDLRKQLRDLDAEHLLKELLLR